MAIRIRQSPEPLSPASFDLTSRGDCLIISSDASRLLVEELRRYCRQEISGRSFLISGHRGAGKTTLMSSAFLEVWKETQRSGSPMRPLFVPLHGPSLFPDSQRETRKEPDESPEDPDPDESASSQAPASASPPSGQGQKPEAPAAETKPPKPAEEKPAKPKEEKPPEEDPATRQALIQTILCLHRAVTREFSRAFRERTRRPELAAQLEVELYECPGPVRLRELWRRAEVLESGVLFRNDSDVIPFGQGMQELVALSGTCEVFRRISGTYKLEEKLKDEARRKIEAEIGIDTKGQNLFGPILALLTGGLVGTGLVAGGLTSGATAAFAGIASALGASAVFKSSSLRSQDRSMSREMTFLYDLSVATLDRALPILIERLLAAGLAPVFVVDELDKVDQLSQRIAKMVHYLKKLVAERAFFCFLTDRSYFEEMTQRGASRPYPVEYTYFTHRLFVTYQPRDFHAYLDELLLLPQLAIPPSPPATSEVARDAAAIVQGGGASEDEADRLFLSFVLLHQSQMHALDLHRRLAALNDGRGNVDLQPGEVRDRPSFRAAVMMQLAVEIVFEDPVFLDRLNREPEFGRLVNDALYYLSRCWACDPEIDLGDDTEAKFCSYLEGRMGLEEEEEEEDDPTERAPVSAGNVKLLLGKVREMALLLSDRGRYVNAFQALNRRREAGGEKKVDASVLNLLSGSLGLPLLRQGDTWKFTWRFDSDGIPIESAAPQAVPSATLASAAGPASREISPDSLDWKVYTDFIENFAKTLEDLTL